MHAMKWLAVFAVFTGRVSGRDLGQWTIADPAVVQWYETLMQPDNPTISYCGSADAYYADVFETDGDRYVAVITDTRDDAPLRRHHVAPARASPCQMQS
jgi:hypothetical protein